MNAQPINRSARTRRNVTSLVRLALCLVLTVPLAAEDVSANEVLCFLSGVEVDVRDNTLRGTEMEIICAHADRQVVALDEESTDLRLLDGDRDLLEAGRQWLEERKSSGGSIGFSSEPWNELFVSDDGERHLELKAHSHALPEGNILRLVGTAGLIIEKDCLGEEAAEPVVVTATAAELRNGEDIPVEEGVGGNLTAIEKGFSGDAPMLALTGAGTFLGLVDPPEGVRATEFFGKTRLVVGASVADDAKISLEICPTRIVEVPVEIEARAIRDEN